MSACPAEKESDEVKNKKELLTLRLMVFDYLASDALTSISCLQYINFLEAAVLLGINLRIRFT